MQIYKDPQNRDTNIICKSYTFPTFPLKKIYMHRLAWVFNNVSQSFHVFILWGKIGMVTLSILHVCTFCCLVVSGTVFQRATIRLTTGSSHLLSHSWPSAERLSSVLCCCGSWERRIVFPGDLLAVLNKHWKHLNWI